MDIGGKKKVVIKTNTTFGIVLEINDSWVEELRKHYIPMF